MSFFLSPVLYLQLRLAALGGSGLLVQPVEDRAVLLYDLRALELEPVGFIVLA